MRYVYSTVRFVPDPARGEFVNIGIIAGSDDSGEWDLRQVSQLKRARAIDQRSILPSAVGRMAEVATILEDFSSARLRKGPRVDEAWLRQLVYDSGNVLQFSAPQPVSASSTEEAFGLLWDQLILEPEAAERGGIVTKHRALGSVSQAFRQCKIPRDNYSRQALLRAANSHSQMDFAVHNGRVVHLTQCWSFQVADQESLLEDVFSWAWTIRDMRRSGGQVESPDGPVDVDPKAAVAVVYIAPDENSDGAFKEAKAAFSDDDVDAQAVEAADADIIGGEAASLLGI